MAPVCLSPAELGRRIPLPLQGHKVVWQGRLRHSHSTLSLPDLPSDQGLHAARGKGRNSLFHQA